MDKKQIVHDLAVAAAAVATYYNRGEIDKTPANERVSFIASEIALRYDDCYKEIDKILK